MIPKILVLLNGWWNAMSGGDKHLLECGMRLKKAGINIDMMIPDDAEFEDYPSKLNLVHYQNPNKKGKDCKNFLEISYLYWQRRNAIIKYMRKHKEEIKEYTHVIISGPFIYDMDAGIWLKKHINPNVKLIMYHHHTTKPSSGLRYMLAKIQEWNAIKIEKKYIDLIITSNAVEQEKLKRLTKKPVLITSHGTDWNIIDNCIGIEKKPLTACFIGRLEKSKGVWDLLAAWERIVYNPNKKYTNARLYIIGCGIEEKELKKAINTMGLKDNIIFQGHVTDMEKYHTLLNCQLFLFPSFQEGFGIVLAEALAAGCDCITYNLDHYEGIFGDHIKTVPQGSWQEMASCGVKSFESPLTLEKINDQVNWCRQTFNWENVAKDNFKMWMNAEPKSL